MLIHTDDRAVAYRRITEAGGRFFGVLKPNGYTLVSDMSSMLPVRSLDESQLGGRILGMGSVSRISTVINRNLVPKRSWESKVDFYLLVTKQFNDRWSVSHSIFPDHLNGGAQEIAKDLRRGNAIRLAKRLSGPRDKIRILNSKDDRGTDLPESVGVSENFTPEREQALIQAGWTKRGEFGNEQWIRPNGQEASDREARSESLRLMMSNR
jgi:hypothetical protein